MFQNSWEYVNVFVHDLNSYLMIFERSCVALLMILVILNFMKKKIFKINVKTITFKAG